MVRSFPMHTSEALLLFKEESKRNYKMKETSHFEHYFHNLPIGSKTHCGQTRPLSEKIYCKIADRNQDADDPDLRYSLTKCN